MAEDLSEKIKDIGAMFGITEIPDSITEIIGSLVDQQNTTTLDTGEICPNYEQAKTADQEEPYGLNAIKMIEFINKYQHAQQSAEKDQNIQLLRALKPFLSKTKQKKIKNCEKMLTIMKMI